MEEKEVHGTTVMTVRVSACLRDGACDSTSTFSRPICGKIRTHTAELGGHPNSVILQSAHTHTHKKK